MKLKFKIPHGAKKIGHTINNGLLILTHLFIAKLFVKCFNVQAEIPDELRNLPRGRYLIVANHPKRFDPWVIIYSLSIKTYHNLLPIRFFTANKYLDRWWLLPYLLIHGCFRAYKVENKISGVKGGLLFSDQGHSLFIFPEGKVNFNQEEVRPKIGIAYLAKSRNFTILPVQVKYQKNTNTEIKVIWGKPFKTEVFANHDNLDDLAETIFNYVKKLN